MRRLVPLFALALVLVAVVVGCGGKAEKLVVRITDNEGVIPPHDITVEYVNERIDRMPPQLVPDIPGDEGKRQFIDDIVNKELLVIHGYRLGLGDDPQLLQVRQLFGDDKALQMFVQDVIQDPSAPTDEEVARHRVLRETKYTLSQIVVRGEKAAWDVYHRVTDGGEDFGDVAKEVSIANSAADGGKLPAKMWMDFHPVVAMQIEDLEPGAVTEPVEIGDAYQLYKVVGRVEPKDLPELEPNQVAGMKMETRTMKKSVLEYQTNENLKAQGKLVFNDAALAVAGEKIGVELDKIIPDNIDELSSDERMNLARLAVVPEFTEDEAAMELVSYELGGEQKTWTLADLRRILEETPGIEGPKTRDPYGIEFFAWRKIRDELINQEIERRKYKESQELKDYVEGRVEEYIVSNVYENEIGKKVEEPTGQEIRDYFRSHREDYAEPPKVDLRQLVVATEAEANLYRQMLVSGTATFEDLVEKHSVEPWSKSNAGVIENYYQGERKLDYLQDVVFDLDVGKISEPFPAPSGFAIVEVLKKYPERLREFSELGDTVKNDILTMRQEARLEALLEEVRATVKIEWADQNLQYVKDTAEAKKEKEQGRFVVTS